MSELLVALLIFRAPQEDGQIDALISSARVDRRLRDELQMDIDCVLAAIKKDPNGFHQACLSKGGSHLIALGVKRMVGDLAGSEIVEKTDKGKVRFKLGAGWDEERAKHDRALQARILTLEHWAAVLREHREDADRRYRYLGKALGKLRAVEKDLEQARKEAWSDFVSTLLVDGILAIALDHQKLLTALGSPKAKPSLKSCAAPVLESGKALQTCLNELRKAAEKGWDSYKSADAVDRVVKLNEALAHLEKAAGEAMAATSDEKEKGVFRALSGSVSATIHVVNAVVLWSKRGFWDPEASQEARKQIHAALADLGKFCPLAWQALAAAESFEAGLAFGAAAPSIATIQWTILQVDRKQSNVEERILELERQKRRLGERIGRIEAVLQDLRR